MLGMPFPLRPRAEGCRNRQTAHLNISLSTLLCFVFLSIGTKNSGWPDGKYTFHPHLQLFRFTGHSPFMWSGKVDGTAPLPSPLSLPESGISHSKHLPIKTADVLRKKRGKLKCRPIDIQAASLMTCTGYFLCALPLWKTKPQTNKWLEVARTDHVSVNSNDFTIKFHLNGYIPLHFFYWAFKLLGF